VAIFVQQGQPWYKVLVPASPRMDLTDRYSWLLEGEKDVPSCEITFDQTGLPLKVHGSSEHVTQPTVTWVHSSPFPQHLLTKGIIRNRGSDYVLSEEGSQYISLVCGLQR
jgi:hypothetical protein